MLVAYWIVGPIALLLLRLGMLLGAKRMTRLNKSKEVLSDPPPRVTVMIPAKDEGERVRWCIESVLTQDYPGFNIVAINDRSNDNTGEILEELAAKYPDRIQPVHVPKDGLPAGWLGKCHALWYGSKHVSENQESSGSAALRPGRSAAEAGDDVDGNYRDWLLFIDSDVRLLRPDAMTRAVALSAGRNYDAFSILTRLECETFFEKLVLPLAAGAWSIMHTISLTNDDNRKDVAYANGQFFLIRRDLYNSVGGHEAVRACITEDVELMRLLKHKEAKTRFMLGGKFASTRMHANFKQMLQGWGRIYSGTARRKPYRIIAAMLFLLLSCFSVYPALAYGIYTAITAHAITPWLIASAVHFIALNLLLTHMYDESGNPQWSAILFPWSGGTLLALLAHALKLCATGKIEWRGTTFDQNIHRATPADPVTRQ